MQNDFSKSARPKVADRVLQEPYTFGNFSENTALAAARNQILDGLILNPKMPAIQLAKMLFDEAEPEIRTGLAGLLVKDFYRRQILTERRKQSATSQLHLPGCEHLPRKIPVAGGKSVELLDANTYGLKEYYGILMKRHRDRRNNDPKIQEVLRLLEKMRSAPRKKEGKMVTVREVLFPVPEA